MDEHIARAVTHALRRRGIEVLTPADAGLLGAADLDYLAFARVRGLVLVTNDADFLHLHAAGEEHAGIAYCEQGSRTVGQLVTQLALIHSVLDSEELTGRVEFL